jgi:hypothetical protein
VIPAPIRIDTRSLTPHPAVPASTATARRITIRNVRADRQPVRHHGSLRHPREIAAPGNDCRSRASRAYGTRPAAPERRGRTALVPPLQSVAGVRHSSRRASVPAGVIARELNATARAGGRGRASQPLMSARRCRASSGRWIGACRGAQLRRELAAPRARELLADVENQLGAARAEVTELAYGIHPTALEQSGSRRGRHRPICSHARSSRPRSPATGRPTPSTSARIWAAGQRSPRP